MPDVIMWSEYIGRYIPMPDEVLQYERLNEQWAHEHNARLDTFTRCQETTAMYVGIIEELVYELETAYTAEGVLPACVDRAKQIMEQKK